MDRQVMENGTIFALHEHTNKKVSVIVPLYNMDTLISKCIKSLIDQTYSNIQIVIIDDGSTDKSGKLADEYKDNDSRITVIHHPQNLGIANGIDTGIRNSIGDYILFLDSDNYIAPDMIEILLRIMNDCDCDVVQCGAYCFTDESDSIIDRFTDTDEIFKSAIILEKEEIIKDFLNENNITNNLSAKLFKRKLFNVIDIPLGRQIVDVIILPQILRNCEKYVCIKTQLYYAYMPPNSVSRGSISNRRISDLIYENEFYSLFIKNSWPEYYDYIPYRLTKSCLWAYDKLLVDRNNNEEFDIKKNSDYFFNKIKVNYPLLKTSRFFKLIVYRDRQKLFILRHCRLLYDWIVKRKVINES